MLAREREQITDFAFNEQHTEVNRCLKENPNLIWDAIFGYAKGKHFYDLIGLINTIHHYIIYEEHDEHNEHQYHKKEHLQDSRTLWAIKSAANGLLASDEDIKNLINAIPDTEIRNLIAFEIAARPTRHPQAFFSLPYHQNVVEKFLNEKPKTYSL